jgi:acid stress chaperone HdeB
VRIKTVLRVLIGTAAVVPQPSADCKEGNHHRFGSDSFAARVFTDGLPLPKVAMLFGATGLHFGPDESVKMMKLARPALLLILPLVSVDAQAQTTVDVTKITCDQFIGLAVASPDTIAIWLNGYYHGAQQKVVVDVQQLKRQSQDMMSYCLDNKRRTLPVMEAAEQVLTQSK